jgi:hypothetical protein
LIFAFLANLNHYFREVKKNKTILIGLSIAITFLILLSQSCKKSKIDSPWSVPTITTSEISDITETTAVGGGDIVSNGGNAVTESGVCWSTNENPTIEDNLTKDGTDSGVFLSSISGLISNTKYYVRAYATNAEGTGYGSSVEFTSDGLPTLTTAEVTSITPTTAVGGGNVTNDGGSAVTARGICLATTDNPTIANAKSVNGAGLGAFTSNMTGLADGAIYYVRAYATNSSGTSYGNSVSFSTQPATLATLTTLDISFTTNTTANSGGDITSSGGATVTARGVCWSLNPNPTILNNTTNDGNGTGYFTSNLSGLSVGTTYYLRAYATNKVGTSYGNGIQFKTLDPTVPVLTTNAASNITKTTATSGGNISSDGASTIIERGVCWSTSPNPTTANSKTLSGSGIGSFSSYLTGLSAGVTYYVRAFAVNGVGTGYGNEDEFATLAATLPTLTTTTITGIARGNANSGGDITSDGGSAITERGVCWGTSIDPTTSNSKTIDGSGTGAFTSTISGLVAGVKYYVRAYAKNGAGTGYASSQWSFTVPFAVGQFYQGGIIAYILKSGDPGYNATVQHGLIAAINDASGSIRWFNGTNVTTGATSTAIGAGITNTATIISVQGGTSTTYAAGLAKNYNAGTYTDWYLPSIGELNVMYTNSNLIGGFSNNIYWSSSELNNGNASYKDFGNGSTYSGVKSVTMKVRAIRKF